MRPGQRREGEDAGLATSVPGQDWGPSEEGGCVLALPWASALSSCRWGVMGAETCRREKWVTCWAPRGVGLRHLDSSSETQRAWNKEEEKQWRWGHGRPAQVATVTRASIPLLQEVMKQLTMAELADLIWTAVNGLGSSSPFRVQAAADMLLAVIQEHGARLETVRASSAEGPPGRGRGQRDGPSSQHPGARASGPRPCP